MEKGDIVFHGLYLFGIVVKADNRFADVHFFDSTGCKRISQAFLEIIDSKAVTYFTDELFVNYFDYSTLEKGRTYRKNSRVATVRYAQSVFEATVEGSENYTTRIRFNNGNAVFSCDCPVSGKCKHEAAVCYKLKDIFKTLKDYENTGIKAGNELSKVLLDAYSRMRNNSSSYEDIYTVIDELSKVDDETLQFFLKYVRNKENDNYSYYYGSEPLIYNVLSCCDKLRERIRYAVLFGSAKITNKLQSCLDKGEKTWSSYKRNGLSDAFISRNRNRELYLIANEKYMDLLNWQLNYVSPYDVNASLLVFCAKHLPYSEAVFEMLKNSSNRNLTLFRPIIALLPEDKKEALYDDPGIKLDIYYNDIVSLGTSKRRTLLKKVFIKEEMVDEIIEKEINFETDDPIETAAILTNLRMQSRGSLTIGRLCRAARRLPHSKHLVTYFENLSNGFHNRYYHCDWYHNPCVLSDEEFAYSQESVESFTRYFVTDFEIRRYGEHITTLYTMKNLLNETIMEIEENDGRYEVGRNDFSDSYDDLYTHFPVWYIQHVLKAEYQQRIDKVLQEIEDEKEELECAQALQDMQELSRRYLSNGLKLAQGKKAGVEYNISKEGDQLLLSLRFGIDKYYVIKNIQEFLMNFRENRTVSYGKNLSVCHSLQNLNENDSQVIAYLLKNSLEFHRDRKNIILNDVILNELMDLLKGRTINFRSSAYLVSLNSVKPLISIDKDYRIHCDFSKEEMPFTISTPQRLYLFDNVQHSIDVCEGDSGEVGLISFACEYNGLRIRRIADQFKNNLYMFFNDRIEVAEEIRDEFRLSTLIIRAYFDYEDKMIKVRKEYVRDETVVDEKDANEYEQNKIDFFNRYLTSLGFVDDVIMEEGKILNFFYMDFDELKKHCEVYLSSSISNKQISAFAPAAIHISYDGVIMKAFMDNSSYSNEELETIMSSLRRKKKYVLLSDNRIIDISSEQSEEFYQTVEDLQLDGKHLNEEKEISLVQSLKALAHEKNCEIDDYLKNMMKEISNFKNSDIEIPKLDGELREYQKDGFRWMSILSRYGIGGILADDMGLGKTIQVIALIAASEAEKPSLIVCPKTLVFNWKNEFMRFAKQIEVTEIVGTKETRSGIISKIRADRKHVYICSYDSLRNDMDEYKTEFDYAVIDEAQYIKNVNALKTINVKKIKADHRFALSGTPIENNLIDLWSIFDFVLPGYFENLNTFRAECTDEKFVQAVGKSVAPFVLRRVKGDVLKDLPEKYERILSVDMEEQQRKIYEAYVNEVNKKLEEGVGAFDILPYLTRLRQICVSPKMFIENYDGEAAKMAMLSQLIDEYLNEGHRILIFSQFVKALNEVEELLEKKEISYYMITGKTDGKERIEMAESFNNGSKEKIMLISLKAGGTGLNLIGADTVIHLDPWWNVAAENQASDRTHRIGQKKNVEIIKIICSSSIEQRVVELQNIKKDLIGKVISDSEESVMTSSLENIRYLLSKE